MSQLDTVAQAIFDSTSSHHQPASTRQPEDCLTHDMFATHTTMHQQRALDSLTTHFVTPFWFLSLPITAPLFTVADQQPRAKCVGTCRDGATHAMFEHLSILQNATTLDPTDPRLASVQRHLEAQLATDMLPRLSRCNGRDEALRIQWRSASLQVIDRYTWGRPVKATDGSAFSVVVALSSATSDINSNDVYFTDARAAAAMQPTPEWLQFGTVIPWQISFPDAVVFPSYVQHLVLPNPTTQPRVVLHLSFDVVARGPSFELTPCFDHDSKLLRPPSLFLRWHSQVYRSVVNTPDTAAMNERLEALILDMSKASPSVHKSNKVQLSSCISHQNSFIHTHLQGGWQSHTDLFESRDATIVQLRRIAYDAIAAYIQDDSFVDQALRLHKSGTLEIDINFAWAAVNGKGHANTPHGAVLLDALMATMKFYDSAPVCRGVWSVLC